MPFNFSIPNQHGEINISIEAGSSVIFVGANGGGKTRLAVKIEGTENLNTHRISAHRALTLNPSVAKISEEISLAGLRTGHAAKNAHVSNRIGSRWGSKAAVNLLNDYDFLIQALFADQSNVSLQTHNRVRAGDRGPAEPTKFERLDAIWQRLLPHRILHFTGDDIQVSTPGSNSTYPASEMSDGERAIFYLIAQTLAAAPDSLLIFDEPELHVHRSIMSKLWDELEAARQDCAFVFITHDLEFAAARAGQKFVVRDFDGASRWTIESVPEQAGFTEELITLILGSRRPILFVESKEDKFDVALYRCCFPEWTVIPRGSCSEVIHSVVTMRRNQALTRVSCRGFVDADGHEAEEIQKMAELGVMMLPVSEIENLILLPSVSRAIAEHEGYTANELETNLAALKADILNSVNAPGAIDAVVMRHCQRRIDRIAKKIDLGAASTIGELTAEYARQTNALDVEALANNTRRKIEQAANNGDLPSLLAVFDNKGLLAHAATRLRNTRKGQFESWLMRVLRNGTVPALSATIREALPRFEAE
jgi:ABC-type cobalamin/Fe3+-siderophores transport system ATPase subunit